MTAQSPMTAEHLLAIPDDGLRREPVDGELRMMSPAGGRHDRIAPRITVWRLPIDEIFQ